MLVVASSLLLSSIPTIRATTYTPGVKSGDRVAYSVTTYWQSNIPGLTEPQNIAAWAGVSTMNITITSVYLSTIVNADQAFTFNNGTAPRTLHLTGDIMSGSGDVGPWVIAGDLSSGNQIYAATGAPTINYTGIATFGGALRSVNVYNVTYNYSGTNGYAALTWERYSGMNFEDKFRIVSNYSTYGYSYSAVGLIDIRIAQTNLTHVPPDFTITGNSSLGVITNTNGNLMLTFHSQNGFAGNIIVKFTITAGSPGATITSSPNPVYLPVDGTANSTITFNAPSVGKWTITVNATSGPVSHVTTETFSASPATIFGINPILFYTAVGAAVAAILAMTALSLRKRSRNKQEPPEAPQEPKLQGAPGPPPNSPPSTSQPSNR